MKIDLQQRHVLITGAGRGIGAAIATAYAEAGATLYLNGRNEDNLTQLAERLTNDYKVDCHILVFDVSSSDEVKSGFHRLFKLTKRLDVLVNNAGILDDALIGMVTQRQIERTFQTNTFSVLYVSQYAARLMQRNGGGSIINLSSIIGRVGNLGQAVYGGSKAAILGITQSLAKELAPHQIRVNAITPGFIDTDMTRTLPEEKYEQCIASIAMGKIGQPDDVAGTALFLGSDLSRFVTGQIIGVDGGMLI